MNVKSAKQPETRIDISYVRSLNMSSYGHDNLYPQKIKAITSSSGTASLCRNRYVKFIEGNGFKDAGFAAMAVNRFGDTADDILHLVSQDTGDNGGIAIHVNYNVLGQIVEVQHMAFDSCRLEEPDSNGYVAHILVHPDWTGQLTRAGEVVRVEEKNIEKIDVFNPKKEVVLAQIEAVGGIQNYQGQILWISKDGKFIYPKPIHDEIVPEMSTDEGLSNVKNRNVRNNFLVACMMVVKKGNPRVDENNNEVEHRMIEAEDLKKFQGDTKGNKILLVEIEQDEEEPIIKPFTVNNYDKEFTVTDESTVERIYAAFNQELFYAIRRGKLGFSGQVMQDAYEYYAGQVTNEQRMIERAFDVIFKFWHEPVSTTDFSIQPIKYINSEQNNGKAPN